MMYQPGAVGFRMAPRSSTISAWYRIDDGPPARWQDDYPALIATGIQIDGPGLDDPTAGMVWLPYRKVEHSGAVRIRIGERGKGHLFRLRGLAVMLDAAHRLGCNDASFNS